MGAHVWRSTMRNFREQYGEWALITGASSGIGLEYRKQLAAKQLNVVMVARRAERLEALEALTGELPCNCRF